MSPMPEVAFCRDIKPGSRGEDVTAHKRAVSRANPSLYPWHAFSDFYGAEFKKAVISMFPRSDGIITLRQHNLLEKKHAKNKPSEWAFDAPAIKLASDYCKSYEKAHVRDEIVEAGFYWYAHRYQIRYSQNRPAIMCKPPTIPAQWDCSMFFTNCHYAGGAPDPNRLGYKGIGYTGTLLAGGARCKQSDLEPGDAIMYGATIVARPGFPVGSPTHVALYVGKGMVLSLGSYPMGYYKYDYRGINCFVHYDI